jgi:hypothetical protein
MNGTTTKDLATVCADTAAARFDEYMDEIAQLLEGVGIPEPAMDDLTVVVSALAIEMFTLGRGSCPHQASHN